ncbi:unnamed protein product, partial [Oncorhynchus mykiss]
SKGCHPHLSSSFVILICHPHLSSSFVILARCISTTVDPETGVISRKQPLDTLKSYRMCDPSQKNIYKAAPLFGQMYIVSKTGVLQVGDVVYKTSH